MIYARDYAVDFGGRWCCNPEVPGSNEKTSFGSFWKKCIGVQCLSPPFELYVYQSTMA